MPSFNLQCKDILQQNGDRASPFAFVDTTLGGRDRIYCTEYVGGSPIVDTINLPDGMIIMWFRIKDPNAHSLLGFSTQRVEGSGHVAEHSYFAKTTCEFHAQRPQHRYIHMFMAFVVSQLQTIAFGHQCLSCCSIHQCKCPAALVIGQFPDVVVVLDPMLFIWNIGKKKHEKEDNVS